MRKFGLILLLVASVLFSFLLITLGSAILFEWDSLVFFLRLFKELFFTLVPGLVLLGILLLLYDRIVAFSEGRPWVTLFWIGCLLLGSLWYFMAYAAGPDSVFLRVNYIVPGDELFSPNLQVFSLYLSLVLITASGIFLLKAVRERRWDTLKSGALLLGFLISLFFSFLLNRVPFIRSMEDQAIGLRYAAMRNPQSQFYSDTGRHYCEAPMTMEEEAQRYEELAKNNQSPKIVPTPRGVREDIVVVGVDNNTIERLKGKWPLDWEVYGQFIDAVNSRAKEAILLFDISVLDKKGVFGA